MNTNTPKTTLRWQAPSHRTVERGKIWYIVMSIVFTLMIIYSIYIAAYTFTILLLVIAGVYLWLYKRPPEVQEHVIDSEGFTWSTQTMEWERCRSFWLVKHSDYYELHINQRHFMFSDVCVHIPNEQAEEVYEVMSQYLPYNQKRGEGWLNYLVRISKL